MYHLQPYIPSEHNFISGEKTGNKKICYALKVIGKDEENLEPNSCPIITWPKYC